MNTRFYRGKGGKTYNFNICEEAFTKKSEYSLKSAYC